MSERVLDFVFDEPGEERLDKFLVARLPDFSRSRLQGLIRDGLVTVDGRMAGKSGQELSPGQRVVVRIPPPAPAGIVPEAIPLDILFENNDLLVINKTAGMVVHPAAGHDSGTLVHAALAHAPGMEGVGGERRPGVVHRLDKDTSGIILLAKNDAAHRRLQEQFRSRSVVKTYLALVDGRPPTPRGRIEAPVGRDPSHRQRMAILPPGKGRQAVSEYATMETFAEHALLEVHPLTGRTHQIRLHLAFIGCPVAGDTIYGRRRPSLPLKRHFLHAARLEITLPGEDQPRRFEAPLPEELVRILNLLRQTSPHQE